MNKNINKKLPWLNNDGTFLADDKLKEVVKSWPPSTWEKYLKSLEASCQEVSPPNIQHFDLKSEHEQISKLFNLEQNEDLKRFNKKLIDQAIDSLTEKQRKVIILRYWNNLTYRQIGEQLTISHPAVIKLEKKAMANMEKHILKNLPSHNCK